MKVETERKYFVHLDLLNCLVQTDSQFESIRQGYLPGIVRVRLADTSKVAFLTIKGPKTSLISNPEFEYEIPFTDGVSLFSLSDSVITKVRYFFDYEPDSSLVWEVDFFTDANEGLVIAELELPSEDYEIVLPDWIDREFTEQEYEIMSNRKLSLNNLTPS